MKRWTVIVRRYSESLCSNGQIAMQFETVIEKEQSQTNYAAAVKKAFASAAEIPCMFT